MHRIQQLSSEMRDVSCSLYTPFENSRSFWNLTWNPRAWARVQTQEIITLAVKSFTAGRAVYTLLQYQDFTHCFGLSPITKSSYHAAVHPVLPLAI